jgi:hypothetical protein
MVQQQDHKNHRTSTGIDGTNAAMKKITSKMNRTISLVLFGLPVSSSSLWSRRSLRSLDIPEDYHGFCVKGITTLISALCVDDDGDLMDLRVSWSPEPELRS